MHHAYLEHHDGSGLVAVMGAQPLPPVMVYEAHHHSLQVVSHHETVHALPLSNGGGPNAPAPPAHAPPSHSGHVLAHPCRFVCARAAVSLADNCVVVTLMCPRLCHAGRSVTTRLAGALQPSSLLRFSRQRLCLCDFAPKILRPKTAPRPPVANTPTSTLLQLPMPSRQPWPPSSLFWT